MAFYNERGEKVIPIFQNGVLVEENPEYINFTGNVTVTDDGMGGVVVDVLGGGTGSTLNFETPAGTIDGTNVTFTVVHNPVYVVLNGATYFEGDGYTYVSLTKTITMLVTPEPGSTLRSAYES